MKIPSIILSWILCASPSSLVVAGVLEPAGPVKPPVVEKPAPNLQAKAAAFVDSKIIEIIRQADQRDRKPVLTRSIVFHPIYTFSCADSAPGNIKVSATVQPFQIRRGYPEVLKEPETTVLSGYYDAGTNAALLYDKATKAYVAPAEHPYLKAKIVLK